MNATGITLSEEQAAWFEARPPSSDSAAAVEIAHYHALADRGERFDKIVSVGMAEHVGRAHLPGYFADIKRLLHPGGLGLVHCITYLEEEPTNPWITKYIFPGGYIPSLAEVVRGLSRRGFVVWDVENIGPSYATTLDRWSDGFEAHIDEVAATYGEEFVRMWRLYLAYCAFSFRHEETFVHQVLFSNGKPGSPVVRGS